MSTEKAKGVVRRNTDEVQGRGNFEVFEELFADDFADHTPQPNMTAATRPVPQRSRYARHVMRVVQRSSAGDIECQRACTAAHPREEALMPTRIYCMRAFC